MTINTKELHDYLDHNAQEPMDQYVQAGIPVRNYVKPTTEERKEREKDLLSWNGITKTTKNQKYKSYYRVYVFQLECIDLFQRGKKEENEPWMAIHKKSKIKWTRLNPQIQTRELLKVKRMAIRSLYILGYDMGMVDVIVTSTAPKQRLVSIAPIEEMGSQAQEKFNKKFQKILKDGETTSSAVLGADLEFVLRHQNGKYVIASKYFSRNGRVGHDAIWLRGKRNKYPIGELRPAPTENPKKLFANIYECLRIAVKKVNHPKIEFLAGGKPLSGYPIGGHIHFSRVDLHSHFIRALDNYLTLPLFLLESDLSISRRPKYGFIGDYREQFHGGFEYRTPPSWITTPTIARGVICLAKVISSDYRQLKTMPLNRYEIQKAFYNGDKKSILPVVQSLWKELQHCPTFEDYKKELEAFYSLIKKNYSWDEHSDLREPWKLPPYQS
ncbi:putative amidoligase domain-containing protein [Caldalkalibacillus mannanilyticus]|uniref:putative amidoligase domain-containing protein n=1 Tax=Caldalkalibacillus mannanilyticus TaxID=1418 RepID=UPI0004685292|nr:hypothetical protein [Caldalkalibacillus mannanilyticus]